MSLSPPTIDGELIIPSHAHITVELLQGRGITPSAEPWSPPLRSSPSIHNVLQNVLIRNSDAL